MSARNAEKTIRAALESIITQTFADWELVVIDDGSTDATQAIIERYSTRDPRVKPHTGSPEGIAAALNYGITRCRGEWIARMDADDTMMPGRLASQLAHATENPELGVISGLVKHGGTPGGFANYVQWLNTLVRPEDIAIHRFIESPVAHPSVMFRRELPACFGGYRDGDFPEDYELWLRWISHGVKFGKVPRHILTWNDSPARLSRTHPRYDPGKFYQTKLNYLADWLRENVRPGREIWLWGAGRITRGRFSGLARHGVAITGHIDIDPKKCGPRRDGLRVILPKDMPPREKAFIVTGVAKRGVRDQIRRELQSRGWRLGRDFIHAA